MTQMIMPYRYRVYTWTVPGQPIPAPRLTQATAHHPTIPKGYYAFKDAVRAALLDAYQVDPILATNCLAYGWPFRFVEGRSGAIAILDYALWTQTAKTGNCRHGDPDNIAKAILDALFGDDRHILPRCQSLVCGVSNPRVEITLTLLD
jgi:hypothetical protein